MTHPALPAPRARRHHRRSTTAWVWAIAAASAAAAALSDARPVGSRPADVLWCAGLGLLVPLMASRSRRSAVLWASAVAATCGAAGRGWGLAVALVLVALMVGIILTDRRDRRLGAVAGALALQCLLRGPSVGFVILPALVAVAALAPIFVSGYNRASRRERRTGLAVLAALVVVVVVCTAAAAAVAAGARSSLERGANEASAGLDLLRRGETVAAAARFRAATDLFDGASAAVDGWATAPARSIPVVGQHVEALRRVADAGTDLSRSAATTAFSADYTSLTAEGGTIDLGRVRDLRGPVDAFAATTARALDDVAAARSPWLIAPVSDQLARFETKLSGIGEQAALASNGLSVASDLLGGSDRHRYLIAFGTTAETRNGGGFAGGYGVLEADRGHLELTEAGDLNALDPQPVVPGGSTQPYAFAPPADWEERYGGYNVDLFLGNLAASPDWPTDAGVADQLFPQTPGGAPIDGAIYADSQAVAGLLQLTGPITVPGIEQRLDADNVEQYLLVDQYLQFDPLDPARKDVLGDVARATFDALSSRPLPGITGITDTLGPLVAAGHLKVSVADPAAESFLDTTGLSGRWETRPGADYLSVRAANDLANKIDSFLRRDIEVRTTVDPDTRRVHEVVSVTVHNDAPAAGLPPYIIGNSDGLPSGTSRDLVTVHSPHDLTGVLIDGQAAGSLPQSEFGGPVYTAVVQVPPGASTTVQFTLDGVSSPGPYRLDLLPQPMTEPDQLDLRIDDGSHPSVYVGDVDRTLHFGPADPRSVSAGPDVDAGLLVAIVTGALLVWFVARRRQGLGAKNPWSFRSAPETGGPGHNTAREG